MSVEQPWFMPLIATGLFPLMNFILIVISAGLSIFIAITYMNTLRGEIILPIIFVVIGLVISYPWIPQVKWNNPRPTCYNHDIGLQVDGVVDPIIFNEVRVIGKNETESEWRYLGGAQVYPNGYFALQIFVHHMGEFKPNSRFFVQQLTDDTWYERGQKVIGPSHWISDKTEFSFQRLCMGSSSPKTNGGTEK